MPDALHTVADAIRRLVDRLPTLIAVLTLPTAILFLLNGDPVVALQVAVFGWLMLFPVAAVLLWDVDVPLVDSLSEDDGTAARTGGSAADETGAVATLRERYASGEIDRQEFERRLNDLLATESLSRETEPGEATGRASGRRSVSETTGNSSKATQNACDRYGDRLRETE